MQQHIQKKFVTDVELAGALGVAVQTLRNWRFQGRGPAYVKLGKMVRYDLAEAVDYFRQHRIVPGDNR